MSQTRVSRKKAFHLKVTNSNVAARPPILSPLPPYKGGHASCEARPQIWEEEAERTNRTPFPVPPGLPDLQFRQSRHRPRARIVKFCSKVCRSPGGRPFFRS